MKIEYQDNIDDYLLHRLSDEDRTVFEEQVKKNKELREQVEFTKDVQSVMKSRNEKLAKMEEWKDDFKWGDNHNVDTDSGYRATGSGYECSIDLSKEKTDTKPPLSNRKHFYWISGIAAMFVAGFLMIQNLYVAKSPDESMASLRMSDVTFREGSDNSDIELQINSKKYDEALDLIEEKSLALQEDSLKLVLDVTINDERKEYDLQFVKDTQDELKWLKAHALLGLGRKSEAISLLDDLRSSEGYYQMSADSLYNILTKK